MLCFRGWPKVDKGGGITNILGTTGGKNYKLRDNAATKGNGPMPLFLASKPLLPFIHETFGDTDLSVVGYIDGGKTASGFDAIILPKVCEVWLKAKDAGALQPSQLVKAKKAEILMRGLAHIGVIALVDEATGYQKDRARDALAKILEAYVAKEIQPWIKTFDADYYEQMFRLRDIPYPPEKTNYKPMHFGHLTNNIVYSRLAPGVLAALKEEAKKEEKKTHLHRHLTAGFGRQELLKHLGMVIGFMKTSKDWDSFIEMLDKISPKYNTTMKLELDFEE